MWNLEVLHLVSGAYYTWCFWWTFKYLWDITVFANFWSTYCLLQGSWVSNHESSKRVLWRISLVTAMASPSFGSGPQYIAGASSTAGTGYTALWLMKIGGSAKCTYFWHGFAVLRDVEGNADSAGCLMAAFVDWVWQCSQLASPFGILPWGLPESPWLATNHHDYLIEDLLMFSHGRKLSSMPAFLVTVYLTACLSIKVSQMAL